MHDDQLAFNLQNQRVVAPLLAAVFTLAGCAASPVEKAKSELIPASQIRIADRFDTREVNTINLAEVVVNCLPGAQNDSSNIQRIQEGLDEAKKNIQIFGRWDSSRMFAVFKDQAWCMHRSEGGWPILAGEALQYTVDPVGPSKEVIEDWYRQIVLRLATVGEARVAYNMPNNSHAVLVTYWISFSFPRIEINYRHQHRVRGTWENELLDLQFTHVQLQDIKTVKWGEGTIKHNPIAHRYFKLPR